MHFKVGQRIHHKKYGYRGVIIDADPTFQLSEAWYEQVATSRPPKDAPWYRVLVHRRSHETYVAEQHLEEDAEDGPIRHPQIDNHFDTFRDGYHARTRNLN